MKNINLKGITSEAVTGVLVLLVALVNAVLQMFGINVLPIEDVEVSNIVSTLFLIGTTTYNVYKNRNISTASQVSQQITDAIKNGELLIDDVNELLNKCKKN
ncbi:phage holin [Lacrimispora indolis]|uniref:phage holin n=1 Tax=Lacrimispora indolis TaxID=69825 RepID=UPI000418860B|nr:phage holin [[Clostridium] methoxybenzovorans]